MKNIKNILAFVLVLTLALSSVAFAAEETTVVEITADAAIMDVTVPTSLPVTVDENGVVSVATDVVIANNSWGPVQVTNVSIVGNGWETVDWDTMNVASTKVNSKKFAMTINGGKTGGDNDIQYVSANFPTIAGSAEGVPGTLSIVYNAKVPAQTVALSNATVASVTFTVDWDSAE